MPLLTVFTPTYNRAYTLGRCYDSLCRQTVKEFVWLVVDDGSTDNTRELVETWKAQDNGFELRYVYQHNQGMHGAHNLAYETIDTEINTCIDSDDWMPEDAVEKILSFWKTISDDEGVYGFLALDAHENGEVVGTRFPNERIRATSYEYYNKYNIKGDKKFILRTALTKQHPYPLFEGEKYVNLATKYSLLDTHYKLYCLNEVVCVVRYLEDGSTRNMFRQYIKNPRGFAYSRKLCMALPFVSGQFRFRQAIHYVSSCLISKNLNWMKESPRKGWTLIAAPLGVALWLYVKVKTKNLE